jgi:hypothetical protein
MEGLGDLKIKGPIVIPSPNDRDVEKGNIGGALNPEGDAHWIST